MSIMASLSSILMQQMVQNMAVNDVNRAYQAQGGKVNIFDNNNSGLTIKQSKSLSALGWATMFSVLLPFIKPLIQGIISGIVENRMKKAPPAPGQKSAVAAGLTEQQKKAEAANLKNELNNNNNLLSLIGNDKTGASLVRAASGNAFNTQKMEIGDRSSLNDINTQSSKIGVSSNGIEIDDINGNLKNEFRINVSDIDVEGFDRENIDDLLNFDNVKAEIEKVDDYVKKLDVPQAALDKIINCKNFEYNDERLNLDMSNFEYTDPTTGKTVSIEYSETASLPDGIDNNEIKMNFQTWKEQIIKNRETVDNMNKQLEKAKRSAELKQSNIEWQRDEMSAYKDALNSLEINPDNLDPADKEALKTAIDGGLTVQEVFDAQEEAVDGAKDILAQITDKKGNIDKSKLQALQSSLTDRNKAIIDKLKEYGIPLTDESPAKTKNYTPGWSVMGDLSNVTSPTNSTFDLGFDPTKYNPALKSFRFDEYHGGQPANSDVTTQTANKSEDIPSTNTKSVKKNTPSQAELNKAGLTKWGNRMINGKPAYINGVNGKTYTYENGQFKEYKW